MRALHLLTLILVSFPSLAQREHPRPERHPAEIVIACAKAFSSSFQQADCRKFARDADQVLGCSLFTYDYQKFDCIKQARAVRGGVEGCYNGFTYDYQRFDCLRLPVSGHVVAYCTRSFDYDFQKFNCLRANRE